MSQSLEFKIPEGYIFDKDNSTLAKQAIEILGEDEIKKALGIFE